MWASKNMLWKSKKTSKFLCPIELELINFNKNNKEWNWLKINLMNIAQLLTQIVFKEITYV